MTRLLILLLGLSLGIAAPVSAQTSEDDRGYVQAFLEDNLSETGREVRIIGFEGALSRRATIQTLTIADAAGIWLTLNGAVLNWNRSAMLRGRLEIVELSARELIIARPPQAGTAPPSATDLPELPAPEAMPFALPDLPVSIDIGKVEIGKVSLGSAVLGAAAELSLSGKADLEGGAGSAALEITRIDGRRGRFALAGAFSNITRVLALKLELSEAEDGIAANLLGLPGRPSVDLRIAGTGPISDYTAQVSLGTDGDRRLSGTVELRTEDSGEQAFSADLSGDVRPLFEPQYQPFFGPDIRLAVAGAQPVGGGLQLDTLSLTANAVRLDGKAALGPDGWPLLADVTGTVAARDGAPVLLSLPGPETRIGRADFVLKYDAATGDAWTFDLLLVGLDRPDLTATQARLQGSGRLVPGDGVPVGAFSGAVSLDLNGLDFTDTGLRQAIGPALTGGVQIGYDEGHPVQLTKISLRGEDYAVTGDATVAGDVAGLELGVSGEVRLVATRLSRFAALVGRPLEGLAGLTLAGEVGVLDGAFDLTAVGTTDRLRVGFAHLDPLIAGFSRLDMAARRTEAGTFLERLSIRSPQAEITANANLSAQTSAGRLRAEVADTGLVEASMSGPGSLDLTFAQTGADWQVEARASGPGNASATLIGTAIVADDAIQTMTGEGQVRADDIVPYGWIAGQQIGGGVDFSFDGSATPPEGAFAGTLSGTMRNLVTGMAEADLLLRGEARMDAAIRRQAGNILVFDRLELRTPQIIGDATGSHGPSKSRVRFGLDLRDVGLYVPDISGPVAAEGVVASDGGGPWSVDAALGGPGGTRAAVKGQVSRDAALANLSIVGSGPLAFANRYITPNLAFGAVEFDLALNGPLVLSSLSGALQTSGARLALPAARLSFTDLSALAQLSGGQAQVQASAAVSTGGRVTLSGPVSLTAPFNADLAAVLNAVAVAEPSVYQTTVDGQVYISGPLQGGAAINGALTLGTVEVRIPETFGTVGADLPGLIHKSEPAAVRQTRVRAGLIDTGRGGPTTAYPLDLLINAPARIFIRGRGVDAELGGTLRLRGTTADVVPEGRFDLIRGRLDILGKRLVLTEAIAQLQGDFDPYLRLVASTDAGGANIRFIIEGLVSELQVRITSSPELPEDEILSRLLFGRSLTQISALQALQIASAIRTLSGAGGIGVIDRLRENFGLDDLDVTTSDTGETGVSVGKYITENIYSDVTVDSSGKSEINLNLSITPSLTGRGTLRSDGSSGVGLFFEKDY